MRSKELLEEYIALLDRLAHRHRLPLPPFSYVEQPDPEPSFPTDIDTSARAAALVNADGADRIAPGSHWGRPATDFVLATDVRVPPEWDQAGHLALWLPLGDAENFSHPEALVYLDGRAIAATDRHHREIRLPSGMAAGAAHTLTLVGWTGIGDNWNTVLTSRLVMGECALVQVDEATRHLVSLARVALGSALAMSGSSGTSAAIRAALDRAIDLLDVTEPIGDGFYASVPAALEALRAGLGSAGHPLPTQVVATGHAHLDMAWLWTITRTRRKATRTFQTVLHLMEEFPEYHYTQSQPQLYDFVRMDQPDLFEAIRSRVREGRWEPIGGMWVEADCTMTGAEALVRQLVLGRRFFRDQFGPGAESPVLWLPDSFGFPWSLPQLAHQAGLDAFFTIKITWNDTNQLPADSFWWQGIDGTRILAHVGTTTESDRSRISTYNGMVRPEDVLRTWTNYRQQDSSRVVLTPFGYGDGGGGPTREMLENVRGLEAFPGMPHVRNGSVDSFFRELADSAGQELTTWNGELYLEFHRGTYTSQGRVKTANRRSERALHDAELAVAFALALNSTFSFDRAAIDQAWRLLCLSQFHDILPGSSIGSVYIDALRHHERVLELCAPVLESALSVIHGAVDGDILLVNPTWASRSDLAFWPVQLDEGERIEGLVAQSVEGGTLLGGFRLAPFEARGFRRVRENQVAAAPVEPSAPSGQLRATPTLLENECLKVELTEDGDIVRVFDRVAGREVLPEGGIAGDLQAFDDRPVLWDAWDIDAAYERVVSRAGPATSVTVVENGPLRATVEIRRRVLSSPVVLRLSLAEGSPRLDFDLQVDWAERHKLLKVAFPVEALAPVATHGIQWGSIERPTHRNTSWDQARFETCAHKWIDLSEGDWGVALLNDSRYGHDVHDRVLRLSLLRAPTVPDPEADQGHHRIRYSLLPHGNPGGGLVPSWVAGAAYHLNDPILVRSGALVGPSAGQHARGERREVRLQPLVIGPSNVVIETVKPADDGRGIVVRLHEGDRRRGPIELRFGLPVEAAWRTSLLEEDLEGLEVEGSAIRLVLRPFEIATIRVQPA